MFDSVTILLFLVGLIGGFIAGLAGIGTGFLLVVVIPLTLEHLGVPAELWAKLTIANTIFATMCSSLVNNLTTYRSGNFYKQEALWVAGAAAITASFLMQFAVLKSHYSKDVYNTVIVIFLLLVIFRTLIRLRKYFPPQESATRSKLLITGISGGMVAAFTGLGGGSIIIPLLNLWSDLKIKKAKSISYATIFATAFILTLLNLFNRPDVSVPIDHIGYVIPQIALPLAAGVIITSPIGVIVSHQLKNRTVSLIFLAIILLVMLRKSFELFN